jgi:hypothetical protein
LDHLLSSVEVIIKKKCDDVNEFFWKSVKIIASSIRFAIVIVPRLAAVVRNEVNPIVVHAILPVDSWRWIGIAAATTSTVAATSTASHTLTSLTIKIAAFGTGRNGANTAIATVVDSITIGVTATGTWRSGKGLIVCANAAPGTCRTSIKTGA